MNHSDDVDSTGAPGAAPDPSPVPNVDRRTRSDRRAGADRRQRQVPVPVERRGGGDRRVAADRRASAGRRGGEYDLDADTLEFIHAVGVYKDRTGVTFPTYTELLLILKDLGWVRRPPG
jgi:hypothetical protein